MYMFNVYEIYDTITYTHGNLLIFLLMILNYHNIDNL